MSKSRKTHYTALQDLVQQYGQETLVFYERVRAVGFAILEEYRLFLGAPEGAVNGVPPFEAFEPRVPYRDAMFSSYGGGALYLEPIFMGICTEIGNKGDDGATWVRSVIEFRPAADGLEVLVGERQRRELIAPGGEAGGRRVCEAILEDVREAFSLDLDEARGQVRIGFVPPGQG